MVAFFFSSSSVFYYVAGAGLRLVILLGLPACLAKEFPSLISGESSLPSITHTIEGPFVFSKVY